MSYRIDYLESVIREDIPELSMSARNQIKQSIERKLATNPIEFGKPLRHSLKGARRLRVGDYRVIYRIEPGEVVLILKIGHRREVYES